MANELTSELLEAQWRWYESGRPGPSPIALEGVDLRALRVAHLRGARLVSCDLTGAQMPRLLEDIELVGCTLDGAQLGSASLHRAKIDDSSFIKAAMTVVDLPDARIRLGSFAEADLENSSWKRAHVTGVSFRNARFAGADLEAAVFSRCDFRGARLTSNPPNFDELGAAYRTRFERCDLRGADLSGLRLSGTSFENCGFAGIVGVPRVEGPYTVVAPDFSADFDGSQLATPDRVYAMFGG